MSSQDLLTPAEAAAALGVHVDTLRRWHAANLIRATRTPSGHRRFPQSEIDRLLATDAAEPAEATQ